jgi:hypothetical protein
MIHQLKLMAMSLMFDAEWKSPHTIGHHMFAILMSIEIMTLPNQTKRQTSRKNMMRE